MLGRNVWTRASASRGTPPRQWRAEDVVEALPLLLLLCFFFLLHAVAFKTYVCMHTGGRSSPAFAGGRERRRTRGVIDRECVSGCSQFLSAPVLVVGSLPGSSFLSPGSFFLFAVLFRSLATFRRTGQSNEVVCGCFSSVGSCLCIVCASCVWELFDISIVWIGCNKETKRHVVSLCSRAT